MDINQSSEHSDKQYLLRFLESQKLIGTTPASAACDYGIQRKFSLKNAVLKHVIRFAVRMACHGQVQLGCGISSLVVGNQLEFCPKEHRAQNVFFVFYFVNRHDAESLKTANFGFSRSIYYVRSKILEMLPLVMIAAPLANAHCFK